MRSFRLSKSRITAGLQCGKRLWLSVHRPNLQIYGADAGAWHMVEVKSATRVKEHHL